MLFGGVREKGEKKGNGNERMESGLRGRGRCTPANVRNVEEAGKGFRFLYKVLHYGNIIINISKAI